LGDAPTSDNDSPRRAGLLIDRLGDLSIDRIIAREVIPDDLNAQRTAREDVQMRIGKRLLTRAISRYSRERNREMPSSSPKKSVSKSEKKSGCSLKFDPVALDSIFDVLDAVAWMSDPSAIKIAQFTNMDPRTVGKVLKNALTLGILDNINREYSLRLPYPWKGSEDEKKAVLRESLYKMPLMRQLRQFLKLGDDHATALRKAATLAGVENYQESALSPLLKWARELGAADPDTSVEDLVDEAVARKEVRHQAAKKTTVAFLSHSSKDKQFVRKLAGSVGQLSVGGWGA
jgi:hypothetical protein